MSKWLFWVDGLFFKFCIRTHFCSNLTGGICTVEAETKIFLEMGCYIDGSFLGLVAALNSVILFRSCLREMFVGVNKSHFSFLNTWSRFAF